MDVLGDCKLKKLATVESIVQTFLLKKNRGTSGTLQPPTVVQYREMGQGRNSILVLSYITAFLPRLEVEIEMGRWEMGSGTGGTQFSCYIIQ
jgi:hypothetical protein